MEFMTHYDRLITRHDRIEGKLAAEMKRPLPDSFVLQRLKREKLLVRDEIESWERLLNAMHAEPIIQARHLSP